MMQTEQIARGDRRALARAITLVESTRSDHRSDALALLDCLAGLAERASFRIGITGTPGVGKSTFIEAFGLHLCNDLGLRVAVPVMVIPSVLRPTRLAQVISVMTVSSKPARMAQNFAKDANIFIAVSARVSWL